VGGVGNEDFPKQPGQDIDMIEDRQVRNRAWCQRRPGASETQAPKGFAFTLQVFHGVIDPDGVRLEEAVELVAGLKAEQLRQVLLREMTLPVFVCRKASKARRDKS
jgi:hypothetical protein